MSVADKVYEAIKEIEEAKSILTDAIDSAEEARKHADKAWDIVDNAHATLLNLQDNLK